MITGAHVIVYSKDAEADRAFFRDVLKFNHVDVHGAGSSSSCRPRKSRFIRPTRMISTRST